VINCKLFDRAQWGGFREGFAELIKRRVLSENPHPDPFSLCDEKAAKVSLC
jgi:hypothetical protein